MNEPDYLYRITSNTDLQINDEGYLTSHFEGTSHDRRSVPLAEEQDLEAVARFFFFARLLGFDQEFLILKVLTSEISDRTTKSHQLLEGSEHHGFIHKDAIKSILKGEWIHDHENSLGDKFKRHSIGSKIFDHTRGLRPKITGELTQEEINELLATTK